MEDPDKNLIRYVDPMIATKGESNGFPGPKLPFGVVGLSPDCGDLGANSGYCTGRIRGFSHLHVSGTVGGPKYGVILLSPTTGPLDVLDYGSETRVNETAKVGYYGVGLTDYNIKAELTVTRRVGFHQYTFPAAKESHILLDVSHCLFRKGYGEEQTFEHGEVKVLSDKELAGFGTYKGGWNMGDEYTVFFYAVTDTPCLTFGTWKGDEVRENLKSQETKNGDELGAFFTFVTMKSQMIRLKVGISLISTEKARKNVEQEIPRWGFDAVKTSAEEIWNSALRRISVSLPGAAREEQEFYGKELINLYSAFYRCHLMPSDRSGENAKWNSSEPYYDDFYTFWDTYRTLHPLLTLVQTQRLIDIVRSIVDIYEHDGYMPDGRCGDCNGRTQGGSTADIVVADAFKKGLKGIDYEKAYKAMLNDAEVPPEDPEREGRGGIDEYNSKGFISIANPRSGTRTVEYSVCDFAIAEVASGLGKMEDPKKYLGRSDNWKNLWDPELKHFGFKGFIRAKNPDGSWVEHFDPLARGTWPDIFYEDNSWTYSLALTHDIQGVIKHCGGREVFLQRLDFFFATKPPDDSMFRIGNEPDCFIPYEYIWAGRPDSTAETIHETLKLFRDQEGYATIPGNDDAGTLSAWYIFAVAGFYPNAGTDTYLIGSPLFPEMTFHMESNRVFTIIAENIFPLGKNIYVQSATLNGKAHNQAWFRHDDIKDGATLILAMGDSPSDWGTKVPPP